MAGRLGGTRECYESPISKRLSPGRYYHIAVQKRLLDFFVQCNICDLIRLNAAGDMGTSHAIGEAAGKV